MYFIAIPFVALLWIPSIVCPFNSPFSMGHSECRKLMNLERLAYCCGVSLVDKFLFVGSNCTDYWNNFGACRYECLYNHWKILDENGKIKKPELYTMITSLYNPLNGYHQYGVAFKEANEDCEKISFNYSTFVMNYANEAEELALNSTCRPEAILHSHCIMAHVTYHCPSEFWRSAEECNLLNSLIPNCIPPLKILHDFDVEAEDRDRNQEGNTINGAMRLRGYFFLLFSLQSLVFPLV